MRDITIKGKTLRILLFTTLGTIAMMASVTVAVNWGDIAAPGSMTWRQMVSWCLIFLSARIYCHA